MPSLKLPVPATDELLLADWLEMYALKSPDGNASFLDLERVLRRAAIFTGKGDDAIEAKLLGVSTELKSRSIAAGRAYPFELAKRSIRRLRTIERYLPYLFCLSLSWAGSKPALNRRPFPRRLFEDLACCAASNYIGGNVVRFASPRRATELPVAFGQALDTLCLRIGEGGGYKPKRKHSKKDDAVDVVAWRHFPDLSSGKLLLFGNCASGGDWSEKLKDLQPLQFCIDWMADVPHSVRNGIRALFIPGRLDPNDWHEASSGGGMVFDRCRIALYGDGAGRMPSGPNIRQWTKQRLAKAA
jgi:hypothetical protein